MKKKLTLSIKEDTVIKARLYAKRSNLSLSELVENYLDQLTDGKIQTGRLSKKMNGIVGVVSLPASFDETAELTNYFENKHL